MTGDARNTVSLGLSGRGLRRVIALGIVAFAACLLAACARTAPQDGATGYRVPHPYSTRPEEILENIQAEARAHPGASLGYDRLERDGLVVTELKDVASEWQRDAYYVVRIADRDSGTPRFEVRITKAGQILVKNRLDPDAPRSPKDEFIAPSVAEVVARLEARYGSTQARYVVADSNIQYPTADFLINPLIRADTPAGVFYVNWFGEIYRVESVEPPVPSTRPGDIDPALLKGAQYWLRRNDALCLLSHVGMLDDPTPTATPRR